MERGVRGTEEQHFVLQWTRPDDAERASIGCELMLRCPQREASSVQPPLTPVPTSCCYGIASRAAQPPSCRDNCHTPLLYLTYLYSCPLPLLPDLFLPFHLICSTCSRVWRTSHPLDTLPVLSRPPIDLALSLPPSPCPISGEGLRRVFAASLHFTYRQRLCNADCGDDIPSVGWPDERSLILLLCYIRPLYIRGPFYNPTAKKLTTAHEIVHCHC